ncbi:MAG: polysaccharide biosynthesis C-terminal domain-containing protein, partial [Clostridia bacterium]|nr:polysaccharide biosynthesis C-terminal domain-containing protein [Clostridia bacterium]
LFFSSLAGILLFFCAKPISIYLLDDLRVIPSLKLMAISLMPISISSMLNGYFCAVRRVYKNIIVQFFEQGVKISLVVMLVTLIAPKGIGYACLSIALGGTISEIASLILNVVLFFFDRKRHIIPNECDNASEKRMYNVFGYAFPVAVSAYVRSALSTIEHLAIPWGLKRNGLSASRALASYGVLHGMVFPLIFFPSSVLGAFSSLLVPEISSSYEARDTGRIKSIVEYVFSFSLLFSLGISGIFICFSNEIGTYFFKSAEAAELIRLIAPLIPLMYLDYSVDAMLKGLGEHIYSMRINIIDSLISVALILALVPHLGIKGYIIVIFVTELFNTSMSIMRLLKKTELKPLIIKWVFKPTLCIIGATFLSRLIFNSELFYVLLSKIGLGKVSTVIEICLCALFYIIFSRISGSISKKEISLAKSLIKP